MKQRQLVLLLSKDESYLVEVSDREFHTKSGVIELKGLRKKNYGDRIKTHLGKEFVIVRPNIRDILERGIKRLPQIVMPKDAALILAFTGIGPGSQVVDAGCGSGSLALFLANHVRPGRVVTYEKDERFIPIAKENIRLSGLSKFIKLKQKDITQGIDERDVDLITLDMRGAERVVGHAWQALRPGGWLVVYSPHIEQVITVRREIEKKGFCEVRTVENIVREWQVRAGTRPKTVGLVHTGWLTFARRVS
jgi:tRNA (adenine57-N1/adenine58-N1)-methyltransferase